MIEELDMDCKSDDGTYGTPKTSNELFWIIALLSASICSFISGFVLHISLTARMDEEWRNESVDSGHAEFYLDENHERQWRWLPTGKMYSTVNNN